VGEAASLMYLSPGQVNPMVASQRVNQLLTVLTTFVSDDRQTTKAKSSATSLNKADMSC